MHFDTVFGWMFIKCNEICYWQIFHFMLCPIKKFLPWMFGARNCHGNLFLPVDGGNLANFPYKLWASPELSHQLRNKVVFKVDQKQHPYWLLAQESANLWAILQLKVTLKLIIQEKSFTKCSTVSPKNFIYSIKFRFC